MNLSTKIYYGPNVYAPKSIIVLSTDISSLNTIDFIRICKKMEILLENYLDDNISTISEPYLYFGKMLGNICFNLVNKNNGLLTFYGAKVDAKNIISWVEFDNIEVTAKALEFFLNIFVAIAQNKNSQEPNIEKYLKNFSAIAQNYHAYNLSLYAASKELDIPSFESFHNAAYRQYGWGKNSRVFRKSSPMEDSYHGVFISFDKAESKKLLSSIGLPVVKDVVIHSKEQLEMAIEQIGYPCVVKPIRGTQAIGISLNIRDFPALQEAYDYAKKSSFGDNPIMIEKFIEGETYRLNLIAGKFAKSTIRIAPILIGDGKSTIKSIIQGINKKRLDPLQNIDNLRQIQINEVLIKYLEQLHLNLESILEDKKEISLGTAFSSYAAGASLENTTNKTHEHVKQMAELLASSTQIDMLGIDYITTDISKSFYETGGAICEFNHHPGLLWDSSQNRLEVARQIFGTNIGKIPVVLIITENTEIEQIHIWLKNNISQNNYGWFCNNEAYIGKFPLTMHEIKDWSNVKMLLAQKILEKLYIVCNIEEIMDKGLPLDSFEKIYVKHIKADWKKVCQNATPSLRTYAYIEDLFE